MKFCEHETLYDAMNARFPHQNDRPWHDWRGCYEFVMKTSSAENIEMNAEKNTGKMSQSQAMRIAGIHEAIWYAKNRPYYKIYPSFVDVMTGMRLSINQGDLHLKPNVILMRLPEHKPIAYGRLRCGTVLTAVTVMPFQPVANGPICAADYVCILPIITRDGKVEWDGVAPVMFSINQADGREVPAATTCERAIDLLCSNTGLYNEEDAGILRKILSATIMLHLIADDADFIKPDVLARDEHKMRSASDAEREVIIERAKRRGKVGFTVGEDYETTPHFRRPHFALRHTGKGGAIPKIVPVVGSVVHRDVLTRVPTGHYDEQGNEVEPKSA